MDLEQKKILFARRVGLRASVMSVVERGGAAEGASAASRCRTPNPASPAASEAFSGM